MTEQSKQNNFLSKAISPAQLKELRQILTGYDSHDLERLNKLIQDPETFSEEIRLLLPLSIRKMVENGDVSLQDIQPLMEEALKESIQKNPKTLANILFPVMMPAIRKAVSEDIKQMLDSINTGLEHGFSPSRIIWRLQSVFSDKTYTEIVLSHAYIYQVKQVFLIHKSTGLLLAQVNNKDETDNAEADMVSGMLTAIKDFVQDSFQQENSELDSITLGDFNIWIEQGPHAILAATVAGNAPAELRILMKESVEGIHVNFAYELEHFEGDTTPFRINKSFLQNCLQKEEKPQKAKKPIAIILMGLVLLGFAGYWLYNFWESQTRFNNLLMAYENTPGVFVNSSGKKNGTYYFRGMQDPLSILPNPVQFGFQTKNIKLSFNKFISLDPEMVIMRAQRLLSPPASLKFHYTYDTLKMVGRADANWLSQAKKEALKLPGVQHLKIVLIKPAPKPKPGKAKILEIEHQLFTFPFGVDKLDSAQTEAFHKLIVNTKNILDFNLKQDSIPVILVLSYTNKLGNKTANKRIAHARAMRFIDWMIKAGIPMETLVPKVVFIEERENRYPVRTVSFKMKYVKRENL